MLSATEEVRAKPTGVEPQMEGRTEGLSAGCPMSGLLEMLTRPWTLHILWLLGNNGPMRFGALRRSAEGISARLLTLRLRTLENQGFVARTVREGKIRQVTYAPTARLADMNSFLTQLRHFSERWKAEDDAQPSPARASLHGDDPFSPNA